MEHGVDTLHLIVYPIFNFCLFLGALIYFGRGPVKNMMMARKEEFQRRFEAAEAAEKKATEMMNELDAKLAGLATEIETMKKDAREVAEAESEKIIEQGRKQAAYLRTEAEREALGLLHDQKKALESEVLKEVRQATVQKFQSDMQSDAHKELLLANIVSLQQSSAAKSG